MMNIQGLPCFILSELHTEGVTAEALETHHIALDSYGTKFD